LQIERNMVHIRQDEPGSLKANYRLADAHQDQKRARGERIFPVDRLPQQAAAASDGGTIGVIKLNRCVSNA